MSLKQLQRKWTREGRKREREQRIVRLKKKQWQLKIADEKFDLEIKHEREELQRYEENRKRISEIKDDIMIELNKFNPFTFEQFLIVWDVITDNFEQIKLDLMNGKINKSDITAVFEYIKNFSSDLLKEI